MRTKTIFLTGFLLLSTMILANAKTNNKTYDVHLYSAAAAGTSQLPAGEYKVKIDGDNAILTEVETRESFTVPVKVQTADKKFEQTAVVTTDKSGATQIEAIEVGGSTTRLAFGSN
jgi:hypothetical protein